MTNAYKIIIIDPDPGYRNALRMQLSERSDRVVCFEKESTCLDNLAFLEPNLLILGHLQSERISRFLYAAKHIDIELPVLILSTEPSVQALIRENGFPNTTSVSAIISSEELTAVVDRFKGNGMPISDRKSGPVWPIIVGSDPEILRLKRAIFEIARSDEALLVEGEIGTGKDLVARAVHFWSNPEPGAFIKVDSGSLTREILQKDLSTWFESNEESPQEKGTDRHPLASRPTFFFDEIGKMPEIVQGILLQFFERQSHPEAVSPTGKTGMRIIASTSENLKDLVETGKFRKDLFYRLNVYRIQIPLLRERPQDIPLLVDFFIDKYCRQLGKSHYSFSPKARSLYTEYDWPGNVRELESIVKSSVVVGNEFTYIESLCRCRQTSKKGIASPPGGPHSPFVDFEEIKTYISDLNSISLKDICDEFITRTEKKLMKQALDRTNWNRKKAAGLLHISYKSLLNKIKGYNLTA